MSLASLMRQPVTVYRKTGVTPDAIGGGTRTESTTQVLGYLEPETGSEDLVNRNTGRAAWLLIVPADTDVTNWDRVTYGTHTFEVVAPPRPMYNPRVGADSHIEIDLEEVV